MIVTMPVRKTRFVGLDSRVLVQVIMGACFTLTVQVQCSFKRPVNKARG